MPGIPAAFGFLDFIALKLKKITDTETHCGLVIDNQYSILSHQRSPQAALGILQSYKPRLQTDFERTVCLRALQWFSELSRVRGRCRRDGWRRTVQRFWVSSRAECLVQDP